MAFSKKHYRLLSNGGPDSPEQVAERIARRKAGDQANTEMMARFSPLTVENFQEASDWQEARIKELMS